MLPSSLPAPLMLLLLLAAGCGESFSAGAGGGGSSSGAGAGSSTQATKAGCSDGQRDAYGDMEAEPNIAACAGGFDVPGLTSPASMSPACDRKSGDDSTVNKSGQGCSAADLCAAGWHLCESAAEVAARAQSGGCPAVGGSVFWATRQAQDSNGVCLDGEHNNLVGCGSSNVGLAAPASCAPLSTEMRYNHCQNLNAWDCGTNQDANTESEVVIKTDHNQGGVLCCRD